jgi:cysteine-rich repeat protein
MKRNRSVLWTQAALPVALLASAITTPAWAGLGALKAAQSCRSAIGTEAKKLTKAGFQAVDDCNKSKDNVCAAPSGRNACTVLPSLDIKGKYAGQKDKSAAALDGAAKGKCVNVPSVLANYPGASSVTTSVFPAIDEDVQGSSNAISGVASLLCNRDQVRCHQAIDKARSGVINEVIKDAVKCQAALDAEATDETTLQKLDAACVANPAPKAGPKGAASIQKACVDKGLTGTDVGSCDPLPGCVIDYAKLTAQALAPTFYSQTGFVCGNGLIEGTEQCDDGNTTSGDGCSAACEIEGLTCNGSYASTGAVNGTRVVTISITTPETLSGIQLNFDYPQFQAGIPGTGTSNIVNARAAYIQPTDLQGMNDTESDVNLALVSLVSGFTSGPLVKITLDNCVAASLNICNRNQNVMNCCNNTASTSQYARCSGDATTPCGSDADCGVVGGVCGPPAICPGNPPTCGTAPAAGVLGTCSTNGGCPGDNACVTQTSIMRCSVSSPTSQATTLPVEGVTCSVSVQEVS